MKEKIGKLLRKKRMRAGIIYTDFAKLMGIHITTLYDYEKLGTTNVSTIKKYLDICGVPLSQFFSELEQLEEKEKQLEKEKEENKNV